MGEYHSAVSHRIDVDPHRPGEGKTLIPGRYLRRRVGKILSRLLRESERRVPPVGVPVVHCLDEILCRPNFLSDEKLKDNEREQKEFFH